MQAAASSAVAAENDELRGKLLKALESIDIREQHAACQVRVYGFTGVFGFRRFFAAYRAPGHSEGPGTGSQTDTVQVLLVEYIVII